MGMWHGHGHGFSGGFSFGLGFSLIAMIIFLFLMYGVIYFAVRDGINRSLVGQWIEEKETEVESRSNNQLDD